MQNKYVLYVECFDIYTEECPLGSMLDHCRKTKPNTNKTALHKHNAATKCKDT